MNTSKTTAKTTAKTAAAELALFEAIAREHLFVETLKEQKSDRLDFHDVSVVGLQRALRAAFEAGRQAGSSAA
jgi:hypothetical protein